MQCPRCNTVLDDDAIFCGNCGTQIAPLHAQGATVAAPPDDTPLVNARSTPVPNQQQPFVSPWFPSDSPTILSSARPPNVGARFTAPDSPPQPYTPNPTRSPLTNPRLRIIIALALLVIAGGTLVLLAALHNSGTNTSIGANASGQVAFIDNANGTPGHTDALKISIQKLEAPPAGSHYDAWLVNDQSEQITALGSLTANGQTFTLNYAGNGSGEQAGTNLLGAGNRVEVTLEQAAVNSPTGRLILSAVFPPRAFVHIKHLLFSFPITPGKIGLLVGLLGQAQLLNTQAVLLQNASANHNSSAVQCVSQGIIDIIEGAQGTAYQQLPQSCLSANAGTSGDGFGILGQSGYAELAAEHAVLAASQSDSTDNIRLYAGHVGIAMTNIEGRVKTIQQDALALRAAPADTATIQQIVTLSDQVYHGVDSNGDGRIDPVSGEAGAITAYNQGQLMATLQLV